jgi:hypothetical protein
MMLAVLMHNRFANKLWYLRGGNMAGMHQSWAATVDEMSSEWNKVQTARRHPNAQMSLVEGGLIVIGKHAALEIKPLDTE